MQMIWSNYSEMSTTQQSCTVECHVYLPDFPKQLTILDVSSTIGLLWQILSLTCEFSVAEGLETKEIAKQDLGSCHFPAVSAVEEPCNLHTGGLRKYMTVDW